MSVLVKIPGPSASSSKMAKKGWKCWAKWLTDVATPANDGYAYQGEFTPPGDSVEAELGDVLLHVDQSATSDLGVVMPNTKGEAWIRWVADASSEGRRWCGPLAKPARRLLGMSAAERMAEIAGQLLAEHAAEPKANWTDETVAHYTQLAGRGTETTVDRGALMAERDALLARVAEIDAILAQQQ
jgi:hypothetical protein